MQFDIQYIFNTLGSGLVAAYLYLFNRVNALEKRVQKLEDIHTIKIDQVAEKMDKLEQRFEELSYNIHKEKNIEGQMLQIMNLVYKELSKRDENNK